MSRESSLGHLAPPPRLRHLSDPSASFPAYFLKGSKILLIPSWRGEEIFGRYRDMRVRLADWHRPPSREAIKDLGRHVVPMMQVAGFVEPYVEYNESHRAQMLAAFRCVYGPRPPVHPQGLHYCYLIACAVCNEAAWGYYREYLGGARRLSVWCPGCGCFGATLAPPAPSSVAEQMTGR